jgi:hypothetical protein
MSAEAKYNRSDLLTRRLSGYSYINAMFPPSINKLTRSEDGGKTFLRNVGRHVTLHGATSQIK